MNSTGNSSSEDNVFQEQTKKLFRLCDPGGIGLIGQNDLGVLIDLVPPEALQKISAYIGNQKINETAFQRILNAIVSQTLREDLSPSVLSMVQTPPESSLEDEMRAIELEKVYIEDPLTEMLKNELNEIQKYEESQAADSISNVVIKKPLYRPIQPEFSIPRVSSLADELSAADESSHKQKEEEILAQPDRIFKVVFVGDSAVGKTCFLHRFCHNKFKPLFNATIGVDFTVKTMKIPPNRAIAMQLWDTAGQERFRSITKQYFRKADGVILMFDVTSEQSFLNVRNWIDSVRAGVDEATVMCLVGNKVDLFGNDIVRSAVHRAAEKLAAEFNMPFYETSAYTGHGIEHCMRQMAENLQRREDNHLEEALRLDMNSNYKKRSWCCI